MADEDFTILEQVPSVVQISVGGQLFMTSRNTLYKVRELLHCAWRCHKHAVPGRAARCVTQAFGRGRRTQAAFAIPARLCCESILATGSACGYRNNPEQGVASCREPFAGRAARASCKAMSARSVAKAPCEFSPLVSVTAAFCPKVETSRPNSYGHRIYVVLSLGSACPGAPVEVHAAVGV